LGGSLTQTEQTWALLFGWKHQKDEQMNMITKEEKKSQGCRGIKATAIDGFDMYFIFLGDDLSS
jgi:hypothetical protein